VGRLAYGFEMVKVLNLQWQDIWTPNPKSSRLP